LVIFKIRDETKGFLMLTLNSKARIDDESIRWKFHALPTRPMVTFNLDPKNSTKDALAKILQNRLVKLPDDAIVKVIITGKVPGSLWEVLSAQSLRRLAKPSMNISTSWSRIG
jgi:hypothetical protein